MPMHPPAGLTLTNWDLGGAPSAWAYLHAGDLFRHVEIPPVGPVAELPRTESDEIGRFPVEPGVSLDRYVTTAPVSGIVVVHCGRIRYERYPRMRPGDRHLLMSITKVFTGTLVGILERRGLLDLAQPADAVVGALAGTAWAGVRIDDILDMASGIDCREVDTEGAYTDPDHPYYRFEASLGWRPAAEGAPASTYDIVAALPSHRPPGEAYEYTGVNTFVLSWIVEQVTGHSVAAALGREVWSRGGFEAPAQLCVSPSGAPASHGGLSVTLRDLARFGMLFTPSAHRVADGPVIDPVHLRRIQTPRRPLSHPNSGALPDPARAAYGDVLPPASRQWNIAMPDGDLFKGGFGGQGLYVSPARDLVIAFAGIPDEDGCANLLRWYSRRIATRLFGTGL